jgi:hypothetical protein
MATKNGTRSRVLALSLLVAAGCTAAGTGTTSPGGTTTPQSGPGISWRSVAVPSGGTGWTSVAFGNGIYAAVGTGVRGASYTGSLWTSAAFTTTPYYTAHYLVFANGIFMATDQLNVTISGNGLSWSSVAMSGTQGLAGLAYGNGKWVVVDDRFFTEDRLAFYTSSSNGASWQQVLTNFAYQQPTGVAFGNGVFVAVGYGGLVVTSPDGATWTLQSFNSSSDLGVVNVVFANNLFLAVTNTGAVFKSSDGVSWSKMHVSAGALWAGTYGSGMYVVVGDFASVYSSPDATTWTPRTMSGSIGGFSSITYNGNGQFMVVGQTFGVSP